MRFSQNGSWSPDNVVLAQCGPPDGTFINKDRGGVLSAWQEWSNQNAPDSGDPAHAYVRAEVVVDGNPIPVDVNEEHQYRRQVNETTYELMVGPEGTHSAPLAIQMADLPNGDNVSFGVDAKEIVPRRLIGF